jgi:mannose-1-phosphate guanylyltransferase/mannose-6-phosphate isomerase
MNCASRNAVATDNKVRRTSMTLPAVTPVIMSGGAGSRLWPLSRLKRPKQFHSLIGDKSLLSETIARVTTHNSNVHFNPYLLLGSIRHAPSLTRVASAQPTCQAILLEPCVRNTAAAVAAAALHAGKAGNNDPLIILPSDAHIANVPAFHSAVATATTCAGHDSIVTFGIVPDRPETGYGYIKRGAPAGQGYICDAFVEKPDKERAQRYLNDGGYYWNGGIFLFRPSVMIKAFQAHAPDILEQVEQALGMAEHNGSKTTLDPATFAKCRAESIDYAVMEQAKNIKVIAADMGWSDVGSWSQVYDVSSKDENGNVFKGDVRSVETSNSLVHADRKLIALNNVQDLVVVDTPDALLIASRSDTQAVKTIVDSLKADDRPEATQFAVTSHPIWPASTHAQRLKTWLFDHALPLWTTVGVDWQRGGVHERLNLDGTPKLDDDYKRVRVLARQIAAFSQAKLIGFDDRADQALAHALEALDQNVWHPEGGWVHLLNPDGTVQDPTRDTYDQAFFLYALAWAYRATGNESHIERITRTLSFMDRELADPKHGGYFESKPAHSPRRSNPHMHFLEAMLACHTATGDESYLDRASKIIDLFCEKFFDSKTWTLTEFFESDWTPAHDGHGERVEPGHLYEWVWLLNKFQTRTGRDLSQPCHKLMTFAEAHGRDTKTGRVFDAVEKNANCLEATSRTWPQTEALKALLVHNETHRTPQTAHRVDRALSVLLAYDLDAAVPGTWIDQFDAAGTPIASNIPASTFYHVLGAILELLRIYDGDERATL